MCICISFGSGTVVVCDTFNDRLVQFSENGTFLRIFNTVPPLVKPSAAVVMADPSLFPDGAAFAVKDHFDIYLFDINCKQLKALTRKKLTHPYGK